MPRYQYHAKDAVGKSQKGIVEAGNQNLATNLLHERGYYIISLREESATNYRISLTQKGVSYNDIVHFTRQLATMVTAGLTLAEGLSILQQQLTKQSLIKLINQLEDGVRGGKTFAQVLDHYPQYFPPIYLALVRAGEASGKLDIILSRLADNLEKNRDFRGKIRGALIYPAIVVSGMGVVTVIVMTVVVPRLTSLYKEFGVTLPLPTQILIAFSNAILAYWWILIVVLLGSLVFFLRWRATWFGRHTLAALTLSAPVFGYLMREATLVEVTRTLSILIDSGVPILTALEISRDATGNILFKDAFTEAAKKIEKGLPLSDPLSQNKLFPPILGQMVSVGEQTGKLSDSLFKLSKYFETEADTAVKSLTTLIEPLIMVVLGLGVGFLVMAVLLPIYSLTSKF